MDLPDRGRSPRKEKMPHPCKGRSALESSAGTPDYFYYFQREHINMPFYLKILELVPLPQNAL